MTLARSYCHRGGETIFPAEIEEYFFGHPKVAHYEIPRYVRFVDEFPMTVTGKLQKYRMREIAAAAMQGSAPGWSAAG